jgi:hypothetical protein
LRLGELPDVEPFPDVVLPDAVGDFVRVVAASIGCPVDFVALPVLVVAGAAIGRSATLLLKPGYFAGASLYGMNVGGPSSGKSPAQDEATAPLRRIDQELHDKYAALKEAFDTENDAQSNLPRGQPKPPAPVKPALESAVLEDCTVEAIAPILNRSPRGILVARDEGSAWVTSLNQYKSGRGSDRQFWLSALYNKPVRVDRKGHPDLVPIRVPHPFVSFVGGMPPDTLNDLREHGGRSDGFLERILFAFPDPSPRRYWSDDGVPDKDRETWDGIVTRLGSFPMAASEPGKPDHPHVFRFADDAKAVYVEWYNAHVDEVNDPSYDMGELAPEGKLCDFVGRLALILQMMHLACDPLPGERPWSPVVSKWAVAGAVKLWSYFRGHHRRARAYLAGIGLGNAPRGARLVLTWLRNHPDRTRFSERDLSLAFPPSRGYSPAMIADGLFWLRERNAVRPEPPVDRAPGTPGRKPSPVWEVHPKLPRTQQYQQNSQNEVAEGDYEGPDPESVDSVESVAPRGVQEPDREVFEL